MCYVRVVCGTVCLGRLVSSSETLDGSSSFTYRDGWRGNFMCSVRAVLVTF